MGQRPNLSQKKALPEKKGLFRGTEGGNRTHTPLRESDFESDASTNSATSADQASI